MDETQDETHTETADDTTPPGATAWPTAEHGPGALLTQDDRGAVVRLAPGEEVTLRLDPPRDRDSAQVEDPDVVEVVPVDHLDDPGYAEVTLLALSPGETVVAVGDDDEPLLTVVVTGG